MVTHPLKQPSSKCMFSMARETAHEVMVSEKKTPIFSISISYIKLKQKMVRMILPSQRSHW